MNPFACGTIVYWDPKKGSGLIRLWENGAWIRIDKSVIQPVPAKNENPLGRVYESTYQPGYIPEVTFARQVYPNLLLAAVYVSYRGVLTFKFVNNRVINVGMNCSDIRVGCLHFPDSRDYRLGWDAEFECLGLSVGTYDQHPCVALETPDHRLVVVTIPQNEVDKPSFIANAGQDSLHEMTPILILNSKHAALPPNHVINEDSGFPFWNTDRKVNRNLGGLDLARLLSPIGSGEEDFAWLFSADPARAANDILHVMFQQFKHTGSGPEVIVVRKPDTMNYEQERIFRMLKAALRKACQKSAQNGLAEYIPLAKGVDLYKFTVEVLETVYNFSIVIGWNFMTKLAA